MADTMYADYAYYQDSYFGDKLTENEFMKYSKWAAAVIDEMTFGRLKRFETIPDCVKDALCEATEKYGMMKKLGDALERSSLATMDAASRRGYMKSESNDGYSISYSEGTDMPAKAASAVSGATEADVVGSIQRDIRTYLANTGLLYRGFSCEFDRRDERDG